MVEHVQDYPTALTDPWDMPLRNLVPEKEKKDYEIQKTLYLSGQDVKHFLVKDSEHPYIQEKSFTRIKENFTEISYLTFFLRCKEKFRIYLRQHL